MRFNLPMSSLIALGVLAVNGMVSPALADPYVVEQDFQESIWLGESVRYLEDPDGSMDIEDALKRLDSFVPNSSIAVNLGFTQSSYWLALEFQSESEDALHLYLEEYYMFFDSIDYYTVRGGAVSEVVQMGDLTNPNHRPHHPRSFVHDFWLGPHEYVLIMVRVQAVESLQVVFQLYEKTTFLKKDQKFNFGLGFIFGAIVLLVLYNLCLFVASGERAYGLYSLYLFVHAIFQASYVGVAYEYLWPESPYWHQISLPIMGGILNYCLLLFVREYLKLEDYWPAGYRYFTALMYLGPLLCLITLIAGPAVGLVAASCVALLVSLSIFYASLWVGRRGFKPAYLLFAAFSVLGLGFGASILGALSIISANALVVSMPQIGFIVEGVLLSLGVARMIRTYRQQLAEREKLHLESIARLAELRTEQADTVHRARMDSMQTVMAGFAHELRNPLNTIIGGATAMEDALEMLEETGEPPDRKTASAVLTARRSTGLVTRGSDRLLKIIDKLSSFARAGALDTTARVSARETLEASVALLDTLLQEQGIAVHLDWVEDRLIRVNAGELGQAFLNVLLNSCQAMPSGGNVYVSASTAKECFEIRIEDEGLGVPKHLWGKIFDPFFTTRNPDEAQGLGLAIAHQIVAKFQGELRYQDRDAGRQGACFVFRFSIEGEGRL